MKRERVQRRLAEPDPVEPLPGAGERSAAFGLHRDEARGAGQEPGRGGDRKSLRERARQRPAAHLNGEGVDLRPFGGERLDHFEGERPGAFYGEAVVGPLHAERDRAAGDGAAGGVHARVAGLARRADANLDIGAEVAKPSDHASLRIGRNEDVDRPVGGACDDRRGERGVAAGRDRQAARPQVLAEPQAGDLQDAQIEHHAHQVAAFMRARDVPRLVLDP